MRPEGSPLDLNNLPEEYGKQAVEESSTTTAASTDVDTAKFKKKKGSKDDGKVYECRFCSLKFCKSQALGGHMNRHRQERETETLNRARQLVFSNEGLAGAGAHMAVLRDLNVGGAQAIPSGSFQNRGGAGADPCLQFRPVYPRLPSQPQPMRPLQPYIYPNSSTHPLPYPPPPYPPNSHPNPVSDYYIGHVLTSSSPSQPPSQGFNANSNYTCFGTPLPHGFSMGVRPPSTVNQEGPSGNQPEKLNWNCSFGQGQHVDSSSSIDRFQD